MSTLESKKFQERLILPLGAKEIEFSVPICPSTPSKKIPAWRASTTQDSSPSSTASSSPSLRSEQRNRSFSSAFLFPVGRSSSPLLSPIPHTSCPSSPMPPSSPCPSPGPFSSPFSSIFNRSFRGTRSPLPSPALIVEHQEAIDRTETSSPILGSSLYTLGSLNPELYKSCHDLEEETHYPEGHVGRVWFSLDYDREKEKLNIGLMRIRNLRGRDFDNSACDPVVRIQLMPGERRYHQSTVQKKTCNPVYNEVFGFHVHHSELAEQSLKIVVLDNSRIRGRKTIGQVIYPLKNARLDSGRQVIKEDLSKEVPNSPAHTGEILVALCYFPAPSDRITVTVLQARNIKTVNTDCPDTFVKVVLLNQTKAIKTKKTNTVKNSSEPCYNESFQFRLLKEQIELTSVTISLYESPCRPKDPPIGRLVLGGFMFARGRGLTHWSEAIARPKEHVQRWHQIPL